MRAGPGQAERQDSERSARPQREQRDQQRERRDDEAAAVDDDPAVGDPRDAARRPRARANSKTGQIRASTITAMRRRGGEWRRRWIRRTPRPPWLLAAPSAISSMPAVLQRADELHQRVDIAAHDAVACLHALDGRQGQAGQSGQPTLVDPQHRACGPHLPRSDHIWRMDLDVSVINRHHIARLILAQDLEYDAPIGSERDRDDRLAARRYQRLAKDLLTTIAKPERRQTCACRSSRFAGGARWQDRC